MNRRKACIKAMELFFAETDELAEVQKHHECPKFALDFVVMSQELDRKEFHYCDPCYTVFAKWRYWTKELINDRDCFVQIACPCHLMQDNGHGTDRFKKAKELAEKYMRGEFYS